MIVFHLFLNSNRNYTEDIKSLKWLIILDLFENGYQSIELYETYDKIEIHCIDH